LRIPRAILGAVVGAGLGIVGAVLQSITRNPLADPYLFGVSSGAAVGAVTVILYTGSVIGLVTLPLAAFLGALASMMMVLLLAFGLGGFGTERLVLTGVAVHFVTAVFHSNPGTSGSSPLLPQEVAQPQKCHAGSQRDGTTVRAVHLARRAHETSKSG
jgi:ABC-type Fe3+-siderophore transport system permease subunit